jgi:hypothetical protein
LGPGKFEGEIAQRTTDSRSRPIALE